jgi:hypothetical protein
MFVKSLMAGVYEANHDRMVEILAYQRKVLDGTFVETGVMSVSRHDDELGTWYYLQYNNTTSGKYWEVAFADGGKMTFERIAAEYAVRKRDIYPILFGYLVDPDYCFI